MSTIPTSSGAKKLPSCTVEQVRIPWAAPITKMPRGVEIEAVVESQWGKATIRGRITQVHRTIIDSLLCDYQQYSARDGGVIVLADLYGLASTVLGGTRPGLSDARWLIERIEDLRRASLRIEPAGTDIVVHTGIVTKHAYAQSGRQYAVAFAPEYVRYVQGGRPMHYTRDELRAIAGLPGVAQAVVRHMRSHRPGTRYYIDTVLRAVGIRDDGEGGGFRRRRRQVLSLAAEIEALGIGVSANRYLTRL